MSIHEHDRDQLLAYLYGALEDDDRAALEKRLAEDDELKAALDAARTEQALLGEAASLPADDVRLDVKKAKGRIFTMRGFKIAASFLLTALVVGAGVRIGAGMHHQHAHPVVTATGPSSFVPENEISYRVVVGDLDGDAVDATVEAQLVDGNGNVKATATAPVDQDGQAILSFEPDTTRPGEEYRLHFAATFPDGRSQQVKLRGTVRDTTRVMTHVATDKPVYRPGETIRMRGIALESLRLMPAGDVPMLLRLTDPRGGVVLEQQMPSVTGVTAWEHTLDADAPGGAYELELKGIAGEEGLVAPSKIEIPVRAYRVPRLTFDIALDRDSYGPGDEGTAWIAVERVEGGFPEGASVSSVLHVDGQETDRQTLALSRRGAVSVPFRIPRGVAEGRVRLSLRVDDGGTVEGWSESVPVALGRVNVELFPEGGDLVAGLSNRVYFRASTPDGRPADLAFEVRDQGGTVATARTDVHGMGVFEMTPGAGLDYALAAVAPSGLAVVGEMPAVKERGVVLRAIDDVAPAGAPIRVRLTATGGGEHTVAAWVRGSQVASERVALTANTTTDVELPLRTYAGGVVRVTVLDAKGLPVAERLVSRDVQRALDVRTETERGRYAPRERVKVTVNVRDEQGRPAQAILGATVVDEGVLAMGPDSVPLPLHFLLGMEVEELEDADLYASGPGAARAVDLLLGVQGWRRFAWRDAATFLADHPETGPRVVGVAAGDVPVHVSNEGSARSRVRSRMRKVDRRLGQGAILGGLAFVFVIGIVIGLRAVWQHRPWAATGGFAISSVIVAMVALPFLLLGGRADLAAPGARMVMEAAGAAFPEMKEAITADAGADGARWESEEPAEDVDWHFDESRLDEQAVGRLEELEKLIETEDLELEEDGYFDNDDLDFDAPQRRKRLILTREYAHRAEAWTGERDDFTEVLYWRPLLVTGEDGMASFEFDTSDSITRFRVSVDAHDARGALGVGTAQIENRIPFYAEPKLPLQVAAGDEVIVPVSLVNDGDVATDVFVSAELQGELVRVADHAPGLPGASLPVEGRGRVTLPLQVAHGSGSSRIRLIAATESGLRDVVTREIEVAPRGYPVTVSRSGSVKGTAVATIVLPETMDETSLRGGVRVYPSTLATLVDGLDGLLQEPHGCFEQASSTTYPNVLVLNYLEQQGVAEPVIAQRAQGLLDSGYALLAGYECSERGYEWWGANPGHEALTAYGLLEFTDMAKTFDVDPEMLERTRTWLLDRRDGDGGFAIDERALDSFGGASKEVTEAYILWALTEAEDPADLSPEMKALAAIVRESDDPYLLALAANAFANRQMPEVDGMLARLASLQDPDGSLAGATTSITSSRGKNLLIETAALAAMAFDRSRDYLANAESAIRFILEQRENGRFGATQATILALRALTSHATAAGTTEVDHDVEILVNGRVAARRHVPAGTPGVLDFGDEVRELLRTGENTITVRASGDEALPWAVAFGYHTLIPANDDACPITVETSLSTATAAEGASVGLTATVANTEAQPQGMVVARVGFPAGLEPRVERLDELKDAGEIAYYEIRPREVTLYWRNFAASESRTVEIDLTAAIPGRYEGPATSAYLYYGDDAKRWAAPLAIEIDAR
jgi:uncharacterized protein YfaS (alpha-2-macroglobulin family)